MIEVCNPKQCTGCGVCLVRCPQKAITMQEGTMGHLYPIINADKCIECGLCKKICPSLNKAKKMYPQTCFALWAKDIEEYQSSTSGGIASILSRNTIRKGGVVYGCAMLPDIIVKHIRIEKEDDVKTLKGSKYVQSSIVECLNTLIEDVESGREVLFIGTPCQVAAVKQLFSRRPENLILVDLICHGVPSVSYLKLCLRKVIKGKRVDVIRFRDGMGMYMYVVVEGNVVYRMPLWEKRYKDLYYNTFIDGFSYRDSCYTCQYARPERCSDVTIGDFWGLGKYNSTENIPEHKLGVSVVLPISDKGERLITELSDVAYIFERSIKEAVDGNDQLRAPKRSNWRIKVFRNMQSLWHVPQMYWFVMFDKILICNLSKLKRRICNK